MTFIDHIRPSMLTLSRVEEILSITEPLSSLTFGVGDGVSFQLSPEWNHGIDAKLGIDPVDAYIRLGSGSSAVVCQLTKDALLEATSICGITKTYAARCPARLLEPQLNYWFAEGLAARSKGFREHQLLVAGQIGTAITRASLQPYSNLHLLYCALDAIRDRFGDTEVLVDPKFVHSLRRTHLRIVLPEVGRTMTGTGLLDDTWSVGVQIKNSLTGLQGTSIDGYLFRWVCTNGAIDTHASSGVWSRRGVAEESEVYAWARASVDAILGGLEGALDRVQALAAHPIVGHVGDVLRDVFETYHIPVTLRTRIIERMAESEDLTMYGLMAAVTEVANDMELEPSHVEALLRVGGDLPHVVDDRCEACQRLMPH